MATQKQKEDTGSKRYTTRFGVMAGYLPTHRKHLDAWLERLVLDIAAEKAARKNVPLQPTVQALANLLETDGIVRMYVTEMINEVPLKSRKIGHTTELLEALNFIIQRAPEFDCEHSVAFPMSALFTDMMFTRAGEAAFRNTAFNAAIRNILKAWCDYLDSPASQGGNDSKVIVSANDGTVYNIQRKVKKTDTFWIKAQPYSLTDMLDNSPYTDRFVGGDVFQTFLSGANYHRWRSPVSGRVREASIVDGLMFSELHSEGFDKDAGIKSQGFEAAVNTRGLVFIEADDPAIGLVCVIPIGITEISSVAFRKEIIPQAGKYPHVNKGEELGWFSYGGSTLCVVFQPGVIKKFIAQGSAGPLKTGDPVNVNGQIALAY